jgi:cell wall-associated NlpC family hydrolase
MLSFILSNTLICSNALLGLSPATLENDAVFSDYLNQATSQSITIVSDTPQAVHRDAFTVNDVPVVQTAVLRSQIVPQSLPTSNSAVANSAIKYNGVSGWDCTMLVEQALRDLGHSVGDIGTMSFSAYGSTFYDPSAVQAGDIMMRPSHVAIYLGNGMAIHGGYNGRVVIVPTSPTEFGSFVRVG